MSVTSLDYTMVKRLILKDWYFLRWPIAGYLAAGGVGVALLAFGGERGFNAGSILLFTILIALGIHLPLATVVFERKDQNLPFVMALPISPREYTAAKILANLLILLVPWVSITLGTMAVLSLRPGVPGGLIPYAVLVLVELLGSACLLLTVAIITDSLAWTVATSVCLDLFFQAFLYYLSHLAGIEEHLKGPRAVWNSTAVTVLGSELGAISLLIALCFYVQSQKRELL